MKRIKNFIHNKLAESMLEDENYIPIYAGEELVEFVYRKIGE